MPELTDLLGLVAGEGAAFGVEDVRRRKDERVRRRRTLATAGALLVTGFVAGVVAFATLADDRDRIIVGGQPIAATDPQSTIETSTTASALPSAEIVPINPAAPTSVAPASEQPADPEPAPPDSLVLTSALGEPVTVGPCPEVQGSKTCPTSGTVRLQPGSRVRVTPPVGKVLVSASADDRPVPIGERDGGYIDILFDDFAGTLRLTVAPLDAPAGAPEVDFVVPLDVEPAPRLTVNAPATVVSEAANVPADLPATYVRYRSTENDVVLVDRRAGTELQLVAPSDDSDLGRPIDPTDEGACSEGCGAWRLIYDSGDFTLQFTGSGVGPGEMWDVHIDGSLKRRPELSPVATSGGDEPDVAVAEIFGELIVFTSAGGEASLGPAPFSDRGAAVVDGDVVTLHDGLLVRWSGDTFEPLGVLGRLPGVPIGGLMRVAGGVAVSLDAVAAPGDADSSPVLMVVPLDGNPPVVVGLPRPMQLLDADRTGRFVVLADMPHSGTGIRTDVEVWWTDFASLGRLDRASAIAW